MDDLAAMTVRDGDRVSATGFIRNAETGAFLSPRGDPTGAPPAVSDLDISLAVDPAGLATDTDVGPEGGPVRWGSVRGTWTGEGIQVESFGPPSSTHVDFFQPAPTRTVSQDPWPPHKVSMPSPAEDAELGLMAEGAILSRIVVRSHQGGEKIAIASTDPAAVEPALRSTYGDQLLMVQVPWTAADYEEAYRTLRDNAEEWGVITVGDQFGPALATHIVVALRKVTPEIAEWSADLPRGLVDVRPWIRPAKEAEIAAADRLTR